MSVRRPIPSLTGLRFVAAMCVVASHALGQLVPFPASQPEWYVYASAASGIGMTLFFVLSGFVIQYNYGASIRQEGIRGIFNFFVARFARLYPLYALCLAYDFFSHWRHGTLHPVSISLAYYLLMMQSWIYLVIGDNNLIYQYGPIPQVSWSISTEWLFYVTYPAICFLLLRLPTYRAKLAAGTMFSIISYGALFVIFTHYQGINQFAVESFGPVADIHSHWQDCYIRWLVYFSPYSRIAEFILGCLSAAVFMQLQDRPITRSEARIGVLVLVAALVGIVGLYHAMFGPPYSGPPFKFVTFLHMSFGFAPLVAVVIFCCARYRTWLSAALSVPGVVLCGEISYSVYLLHIVVILVVSRGAISVTHLSAEVFDLALVGFALIATIGVSFISYTLWESPTRRVIRKALTAKRRYVADTASTAG
jgi:peptidoglycan/LPS O-acetylase OafA/YrhL